MTILENKPVNKRVPVKNNLFLISEDSKSDRKPRLIGSKCKNCGEVVFPAKTLCPNCSSDEVEERLIGPTGTLYSFTVVYQAGPMGYKGPVPYGVVKVEMPEGLRITGYSTENNPCNFLAGMEMELVIDKLFTDDEGTDVIGFKFKPISSGIL